MLTTAAEGFVDSAEYESDKVRRIRVRRIRPVTGIAEVVLDPLRAVRRARRAQPPYEIVAEQYRAGESVAAIADIYELPVALVEAARRYELVRAPSTVADAAKPLRVSPDPARLRFFADESVLGLGKVLTIARRDVIHARHPLIPDAPLGALDPEWIPAVAKRDLVVIARDRRIRTKPAEVKLLSEHGLRVFWIGGKRDLATWDDLYLVRVVRGWEDIESNARSAWPRPVVHHG